METRRTNQFLKVALGTRSPARQKLFKSHFHDSAKYESRLPISGAATRAINTSYNNKRGQNLGQIAALTNGDMNDRRAATSKEGEQRYY